jgi:opacity protein-like surface antigen
MKFAFFSTALLASCVASAAPAVNGWYVNAFGGYSSLPSNINTGRYGVFLSNVRYHDGYNVGGRIGFQSNPIRYEFEYTYISAHPNSFRVDYFSQPNVGGRLSQNLLMANLYYDFPEILDTISPFIGGGIGYGFLETTLTSTGPFLSTFFKEKGNSFAYQGTAGLTYNFAENYAINAAYRYVATANNRNFGRSFQAQMGSAGITYRFDCGTYK